MKTQIKNYLIPFAAAAAITLIACWACGAFSSSGRDTVRLVCDGFFVAGVLTTCFGVLFTCAGLGALDGLRYSVTGLFLNRIARTGQKEKKQKESYREYSNRRSSKNKKGFLPTIIIGVLFLTVSLILLIIYYQY